MAEPRQNPRFPMLRLVDHKCLAFARRRWLALACLLAIGCVNGCGASVSEEQKAAIARIQDLGGRVNYKRGGYEVDLNRSSVENQDLAQLAKIPNLKTVTLDGTRISDEGLQHLHAISSLEFVTLRTTAVTSEGIANLKKALPNVIVTY
jgi:hypothetical protein